MGSQGFKHLEVGDEQAGKLVARCRQHVETRVFGAAHTGGRHQRERLDAVPLLRGEMRGEQAAEREADQMDLVDPERVEQLDVVHDVVVDRVHRRIVARLAEARDDRDG